MSLNNLFRNARKAAALKNAALATTLVAGVAGFSMMTKSVNSDGTVVESNSSSISSGANNTGASAGFATSNLVIKPNPSDSSSRGSMGSDFNFDACIKSPSAENCMNNDSVSQKDWDQFLPPEGIVVRDARGNVVFKKCRSLTEGAAAAKKEMEPEKDRFDKFTTAMNIHTGNYNNTYKYDNDGYNACRVSPTQVAPQEEPCPTYKNYTDLKDYYREQYYLMSNQLQKKVADNYECADIHNGVMAAVDPNWKNDPSISTKLKASSSESANRGVR